MLLYFGHLDNFENVNIFPYSSLEYYIDLQEDVFKHLNVIKPNEYKFIFCFLKTSFDLYLTIKTTFRNVILIGDNSPDVDTLKINDVNSSLLKIMLSRDFPTLGSNIEHASNIDHASNIEHDIYNYFFPIGDYKTRWFKPVIEAWIEGDTNTANTWLSQEKENSTIVDWLVMIRKDLYINIPWDKIENIIRKWKIENGFYI
jgi:hypothetical protein